MPSCRQKKDEEGGEEKGLKCKTCLVKGHDVHVVVHSRQAVDFLLEQIGVEAWSLFADDFHSRQNSSGDLLSEVGYPEGPSSQLVRSNIPFTCHNVKSILQVGVLYRNSGALVTRPAFYQELFAPSMTFTS